MNRNIALMWGFTVVVLMAQALTAYPELPFRIASSFDFSGQPRRFGDKDTFFISWSLGVILLNSCVLLMKPLFRWAPDSTINLPNREYWFANPERKAQAANKMTDFMAAVFTCVNIMMILVFQYIYDVNIHGQPGYPFWVPLMIVPVLFIFPVLIMFRLFRIPMN